MRLWIAALALAVATFGMATPAAHASTLATVTSINGSAVVMRGNKVEKLTIGAKIEPGDRIIVASGGIVKLSSGASLGAGSSTVTKTKSGGIEIASTTSTSGSTYTASSPSSKLFSDDSSGSGKSSKSGKSYGKKDDRKDDDDHDDDDHDDEDEHEHGNPHDPKPVSYH